MAFDDLDEAGDGSHVLLELFGEFLLLLVPPGPLQGYHLGPQRGHALLDLAAEFPEVLREPPQFFGVDDGLRHGISLPAVEALIEWQRPGKAAAELRRRRAVPAHPPWCGL